MLELTLATLLSTMSEDFCALMETEKDVVKATLIAYSMANKQYGPENVIDIINQASPLEIRTIAVSSVVTKCPNKL
jgi:hypothetical protein